MLYIGCDCETTGVSDKDRIVELAYVVLDEDLNVIDEGESLIDPEMSIPSGASAVNGITDDMVADAPTIEQYMTIVKSMPLHYDDAVFIAHNAAFDFRYLGPWMHEDTKQMCTLRLARRIYPDLDSHKLQALRYSLGLEVPEGDAHRAMFDVRMMFNLIARMREDTGLDLAGLLDLSLQPRKIEKMPFGKYKGVAISKVPKDYITWLLKQTGVDADLRWTLENL